MVEVGRGMAEPLIPPVSPRRWPGLAVPSHLPGHLTSTWGRTSCPMGYARLARHDKPSLSRAALRKGTCPFPLWVLLGRAGWAARGECHREQQEKHPAQHGQGSDLRPGAPPDDALLARVVQGHEELRLLPDVADEVADAQVEVVRGRSSPVGAVAWRSLLRALGGTRGHSPTAQPLAHPLAQGAGAGPAAASPSPPGCAG